jgi:hypothetical protein
MKLKKRFGVLLILAMLVSMLAMSLTANAKTKISNKSLTIAKGGSYKLSVNTKKKATWSSSNTKVATVSKKGNVKGVSNGKCTITAKVGGKKYTCKVKVVKPSLSFPDKLKDSDFWLLTTGFDTWDEHGEYEPSTLDLNPYLKKEPASLQVKWSSSDTSVATVKDGIVTGKKYGVVRITAKAGKAKASVIVKISENIENDKVVTVTEKNFEKYFQKIEYTIYRTNTKDHDNTYYYEEEGAGYPVDLPELDEKGKEKTDENGNPIWQYFDGMETRVAYVLKNPDAFDLTKSNLNYVTARGMSTKYDVTLNGTGYTRGKQVENSTAQVVTFDFAPLNRVMANNTSATRYGYYLPTDTILYGNYSSNVVGQTFFGFEAILSATSTSERFNTNADSTGYATRIAEITNITVTDASATLYYK